MLSAKSMFKVGRFCWASMSSSSQTVWCIEDWRMCVFEWYTVIALINIIMFQNSRTVILIDHVPYFRILLFYIPPKNKWSSLNINLSIFSEWLSLTCFKLWYFLNVENSHYRRYSCENIALSQWVIICFPELTYSGVCFTSVRDAIRAVHCCYGNRFRDNPTTIFSLHLLLLPVERGLLCIKRIEKKRPWQFRYR